MSFEKHTPGPVCTPVPSAPQTPKKAPTSPHYTQETANSNGGKKGSK